VIRIIVKVDRLGPEGQALSPLYRTVDIRSPQLEAALKPPSSYSECGVVGAEIITDSAGAEPK
jgi:hypothetical protein